MATVRVLFTQTRTVQRDGGLTYEEGKEYTLPSASARHWIERGAAVAVKEATETPEPTKELEVPKDEQPAEEPVAVVAGDNSGGDGERAEQLPASQTPPQRGRRSGNRNQ